MMLRRDNDASSGLALAARRLCEIKCCSVQSPDNCNNHKAVIVADTINSSKHCATQRASELFSRQIRLQPLDKKSIIDLCLKIATVEYK